MKSTEFIMEDSQEEAMQKEAEAAEIINDEDYVQMYQEYGMDFVEDHASNHYPEYLSNIKFILRSQY